MKLRLKRRCSFVLSVIVFVLESRHSKNKLTLLANPLLPPTLMTLMVLAIKNGRLLEQFVNLRFSHLMTITQILMLLSPSNPQISTLSPAKRPLKDMLIVSQPWHFIRRSLSSRRRVMTRRGDCGLSPIASWSWPGRDMPRG